MATFVRVMDVYLRLSLIVWRRCLSLRPKNAAISTVYASIHAACAHASEGARRLAGGNPFSIWAALTVIRLSLIPSHHRDPSLSPSQLIARRGC